MCFYFFFFSFDFYLLHLTYLYKFTDKLIS
jgi:hypothetical protein